jgi:tetratricopeptide (TPR) repeat protein
MPDTQTLLDEGLRHQKSGALDRALECYCAAAAGAEDAQAVSEALRRQATVHRTRSDFVTALEVAEAAASAASMAGLVDQYAEAMNTVASVHLARGAFPEAVVLFETILGITQDQRIRGNALQNLGSISAQQGDFETARRQFMASHQCFQEVGYDWGEAFVLNNFGRAALDHGNFVMAASMLENAVGAAKRVEDRDLLALATLNHAEAIAGQHDLPRAEGLARSALEYFITTGNKWRRVECLRLLGDIAATRGESDVATRFFEEGLAMAEEIGASADVTVLRGRLSAGGSGDKNSRG